MPRTAPSAAARLPAVALRTIGLARSTHTPYAARPTRYCDDCNDVLFFHASGSMRRTYTRERMSINIRTP